ncbi:MAG TPA: periplasmic heavy metal sensor [Polyangiaceae bacterium]
MTPLAKRLSIALAVSIALNLLLAGIFVGRAFHRPPHPPEREMPAFRGERDGKRAPLRKLLREHGDELRERRGAIAEARRRAQTALEAEPFDRAAVERALEALRNETVASQKIMHDAIAGAASKGTPEERRKLGHALDRAGLEGNERRPGPKHGR